VVKRYKTHVSTYKRYLNNKSNKYLTSYEILKFDNHYIDVIEFVKTNDKRELQKIEGQWIKQFANICVNHNIAGRNKKQYKQDNFDTINQYQKSYQQQYQPKYRLSHSNYQVNYKLKQTKLKILKIGYLAVVSILLQYKLF